MALSKILPASQEQYAGARNLIINGSQAVWQRGVSQTVSGNYGADRFWMANATSATRDTDAPSGFVYSTKLTYNSSDMSIGQPVELPATGEQGQLISGQTVTLSYYAKVDAGTEAISTAIKFRDAKFSATNEVAFTPTITNGQNATWTTTWIRYTHSFTIPTVASTNVLAGLEIGGIGKTAYITGVQLEVGEQATPFEHRSYADELARCQRYYENNYPKGSAVGSTFANSIGSEGLAFRGGAGTVYTSITFKEVKRAAPTITIQNGVTGNTGSWRGSSSSNRTTSGIGKTYSFVADSGTAGDQLYRCAFFEADAEL